MPLVQTVLLIIAASLVAVADVLLKKTYQYKDLGNALLSPWMAGAVLLYVIQIIIFTYLFISGAKLSYVGVMQIIFYALIILGASIFFFKESITLVQGFGILFALTGVILLNI